MSRRQRKRRRHTGSRILLFVLMAVILLILAGIYVGVSMYYRTHFFPGTYRNGLLRNDSGRSGKPDCE